MIMSKATRKDAVNWFELFVTDFDRAKRFYETVLQASMQEVGMTNCRMAMFPYDNTNGVGGSITKGSDATSPGQGGTLVYLNVEGDLDGVLKRIEALLIGPEHAAGSWRAGGDAGGRALHGRFVPIVDGLRRDARRCAAGGMRDEG